MKMRFLLAAGASLLIAALSPPDGVAETPASAIPADPYAVVLTGKYILAFGQDRQLWQRAIDGGAWRPVPRLDGEAGFLPLALTCAGDGSGACVETWRDKTYTRYDLYDPATGGLKRLPDSLNTVVAFPDKDTLFFSRPEAGGVGVFIWHPDSGIETRLGTVAEGEGLIFAPIDGKDTPVAQMPEGGFRVVSDTPDAPRFHLDTVENMMPTGHSWVGRELWSHTPPAIADRRALYELTFARAEKEGRPQVAISGQVIAAFPTAQFLPDETNGAIDAAGDLVNAFIGPQGTRLGYLCMDDKGGPSVNIFFDPGPGETVHVSGSRSARGFLLQHTGLLHSPDYDIVQLSPADGGWRGRKCSQTTLSHASTGIPVDRTDTFETANAQTLSADGTVVPYVILKPKGIEPEHVLIDVYGSYGFVRAYNMYHKDTNALLTATRTALVFPVVRGDGDRGYDYALASRAPNRQRAVDDVIAVAKDVTARFPALKARPLVRGKSAGGWLAMRAALARPDVFSGAIGYSGVYSLKGGDHLTDTGNGLSYFTPDDDLAPGLDALKGNCHGLEFRILHARDDAKVSFQDAQAFDQKLTAQGCASEFVAFDTGGHAIALSLDQAADAERRLRAYFTPF